MALVLATQLISLLLSKTMGPDAGRSFNHIFSEKTMVFVGIAVCVIWYFKERAQPGHSHRD
jgi:hypothetical protein